jgi:hypothetical protein
MITIRRHKNVLRPSLMTDYFPLVFWVLHLNRDCQSERRRLPWHFSHLLSVSTRKKFSSFRWTRYTELFERRVGVCHFGSSESDEDFKSNTPIVPNYDRRRTAIRTSIIIEFIPNVLWQMEAYGTLRSFKLRFLWTNIQQSSFTFHFEMSKCSFHSNDSLILQWDSIWVVGWHHIFQCGKKPRELFFRRTD